MWRVEGKARRREASWEVVGIIQAREDVGLDQDHGSGGSEK